MILQTKKSIKAFFIAYFHQPQGTPNALPSFYPYDHMYQKNSQMQRLHYAGGSAAGQVGVIIGFGVKEVSRENYSKWNPHVSYSLFLLSLDHRP